MTTITYDSTPADQPEFSEEELESIKVGEQLQQEQESLLAGKYENAEELEKAYLELQGEFSKGNREPEEQTEEEGEVEEVENDFVSRLLAEAEDEYSEELLTELDGMDPRDLAQMFLDHTADTPQTSGELTPEDVDGLYGSVGGETVYKEMIGWAGQNLTPQQINMFDAVVENGDPLGAYFAIQFLNSQYQDAMGIDGEMLTGKPAVDKVDSFRSQAEMVAAMNDPRYDADPAYRQDVYAKIERSNLD